SLVRLCPTDEGTQRVRATQCRADHAAHWERRIHGRQSLLHEARHPLPARNERGEDRGEGKPIKTHLLSPALSSIRWRRGRNRGALCSPVGVAESIGLNLPALPGIILARLCQIRRRLQESGTTTGAGSSRIFWGRRFSPAR